MDRTIGTCSKCGGRVTIPAVWMGTVPPIPTCASCAAHPKNPHGPVIDMEDSRVETSNSFTLNGDSLNK